jgi:hypothetical protein
MNGEDDEAAERSKMMVEIAKKQRYVHRVFSPSPSLITLQPNDERWFAEHPYDGGPFDPTKYRLKPQGWDHSHCFICNLRIVEGDKCWAAIPPAELDLCEPCYRDLFPGSNGVPQEREKAKGP